MFQSVYSGRRVLVTGHTGFKGSWLCQWLLDLGAEVAGYALAPPTTPNHFDVLGLGAKMRSVLGDINDYRALQAHVNDFQPEVIFHLAAQPLVAASLEDPVGTFSTNLLGTVKVLELLRHSESVRAAVMVTSDKCYENVEWEHGYRENDALGGKDPYSASKACAELAFRSYWRSYFQDDSARLACATGRAGNVIGGGDWASHRIIPDVMRAAGEKPQRVAEVRSPQATRPWQHVLEPLSGYLWLGAKLFMRAPGVNGEAFNFGPKAEMNESVAGLLTAVQRQWPAAQWQSVPSALAVKEAGLLRLSCDKALNRLAWGPTFSFAETVTATTEWYRSFYEEGPAAAAERTRLDIRRYTTLALNQAKEWTTRENSSRSNLNHGARVHAPADHAR